MRRGATAPQTGWRPGRCQVGLMRVEGGAWVLAVMLQSAVSACPWSLFYCWPKQCAGV